MSYDYFEDYLQACKNGDFFCPDCDTKLRYDEDNDLFVCPECEYSIAPDWYGYEDDEDEEYYPTEEEVLGYDADDDEYDGEYYDPDMDE